jgi:tRNA(Ile2) C34 agmatinyltransferase TiaS
MDVRCPHCGKRTFSVAGWADTDRCPRCGRPLVELRPDEVERNVRAYLYGAVRDRAGKHRRVG